MTRNQHAPADSSKPHILMIVGSLRRGSFNRQLAHEIALLIGDRARVSCLDYAQLPFLNQDLEPEATAEVRRVRADVAQSDAVWFVSPEYNHSIPAVLKNLIDWLSRPAETGNLHPLSHLPAAISGVGMEANAGYGLAELAKIVDFIGFSPINVSPVGIHVGRKETQAGELALSSEERAQLSAQVDAVLSALGSGDFDEFADERPKSDTIQASS